LKQSFTTDLSGTFKKILCAVLLVASGISVQAQKRKILNLPNYDRQRIHFGFILGVNSLNFISHPIDDLRDLDSVYAITPKSGTGFSLGIVSNLHITQYFDLRFLPTLSFGERSLMYTINYPGLSSTGDSVLTKKKTTESTLLEFPLLLKYKSARHGNFRTYVIGGLKPVIDIASQDKVDDKGEKRLKLKKNDLNYEIGVGFDFYSQYFKFTPEFKLSYGLKNLLVQENNVYTAPLDRLTSRAWYISFTFE